MSKRNSEGKRSARERLREQQAKQRVAERRARVLKVGAVVVAVLGTGTVAGVLIADGGGDSGGESPSAKPVTVGRSSAPATLTVYEDFRCPACGQFENQYRSTIQDLEKAGKLKTEYHIVTLIDQSMGGNGSTRAANAALCAKDEGQQKFRQYHDVLFQNQPQEQDDAFGSDERLLELAGEVDGLDNARFRKCVDEGGNDARVKRSNAAFKESDHQGTPTVLLDGEDVYGNQQEPLTPEKLREKVEDKAEG